MTATDELRRLLDERGVEWADQFGPFPVTAYKTHYVVWIAKEYTDGLFSIETRPVTPEQAIAATLSDEDYERKMDALLCRLTNGKFSKSRAYDLDFMESCVNEEFEMLYADELNAERDEWKAKLADLNAMLGGGECEMVTSGTPCDGNADKACTSCGAYNIGEYYDGQGHIAAPKFCPEYGRRVKAVER